MMSRDITCRGVHLPRWAFAVAFLSGLVIGGFVTYQWQSATAEKAAQAAVEAAEARDAAQARADSIRALWEVERAASDARGEELRLERARADSLARLARTRRVPAVRASDSTWAELRGEIQVRAPELEPLADAVQRARNEERDAHEAERATLRDALLSADSTNALLVRREAVLADAFAATLTELEAERARGDAWETAYRRATRTGLRLPLGIRVPHEVGYTVAIAGAAYVGYQVGRD